MADLTRANTIVEQVFESKDNTELVLLGSELRLHSSWDPQETGELLGYLVAIPQVVPWQSSQLPDVVAASQSGGPPLQDYTVEWFEKLIYVGTDQAQAVSKSGDLRLVAAAEGFIAADQALASAYSLGCAKTAPLTTVLKLNLATMAIEPLEGQYHAVIDEFVNPPQTIRIRRMRIVRAGGDKPRSLIDFTSTERHRALKALHTARAGTTASDLETATLAAIRDPRLGIGRPEPEQASEPTRLAATLGR